MKRKPLALKKTVAGIGKSFAARAERVADIIIDDAQKVKSVKVKAVTRETVGLFKDVRRQVSSNLQNVFSHAAYGMGKLSGKTKRACCSLSRRRKPQAE